MAALAILAAPVTGHAERDDSELSHARAAAPVAKAISVTADKRSLLRTPQTKKLRSRLDRITRAPALKRGTTAIVAVDVETGALLYSRNAAAKLNPASNVKLISTAAALDLVGPDFRYTTRLFGHAPIDGVSTGDLYLRGSGDPTIDYERYVELGEALKRSGIDKIAGDIVLSSDNTRDIIGLPRVRLDVRGRRNGRAPHVDLYPNSEFVDLKVKARVKARGRTRLGVISKFVVENGKPRWKLTLTGTIRRGHYRKVRRYAPRISTFTGYTLKTALAEAGVVVEGKVKIAEFADYVARAVDKGSLPVSLATDESPPFSELVAIANKYSVNHLADRLILTASAVATGTEPSMRTAVTAMRQWMEKAGVDTRGLVLDTGSGLSYNTKLTANSIVRVLRAAAGHIPDVEFDEADPELWRDSLSVGAVDGTLRRRFRGSAAAGHVIGKTGTLTRCHALSGFVIGKQGRRVAFAIVTNGNERRARRQVRKAHEALVKAMYSYVSALPEHEPVVAPATAAVPADKSL